MKGTDACLPPGPVPPTSWRGPGHPREKDAAFEPARDESWVSLEVDAMAAAWSRGRRITAGEIIDRHPGIADEAAVRLIYEEVNLRRESGEDVATTEVVGRYARWKDELEVLLGCDRLLRPIARAAELPEVGEHLGPFFLRAELGRGASGRTYLASEPTLANRPVVLKVISDDQEEHLSLARLQHTNIIPLFSEHSFPERGLRRAVHALPGRLQPGANPRCPRRDPARRSTGTGHHPRAGSGARRRAGPHARRTGLTVVISSTLRTSTRSAGSAPGWPTRFRRRTRMAWCTWMSSRRTC